MPGFAAATSLLNGRTPTKLDPVGLRTLAHAVTLVGTVGDYYRADAFPRFTCSNTCINGSNGIKRVGELATRKFFDLFNGICGVVVKDVVGTKRFEVLIRG